MDRVQLIWQLKKHGHPQDELDVMRSDDLIALFKKETKEKMLNYIEYLQNDQNVEINDGEEESIKHNLEKIFDLIHTEEIDFISLYGAIYRIFEEYNFNEASDLILNQVSDKRYKQISQIIHMVYRTYQETLLDQIKKLCSFYPEEELAEQMHIYNQQRDNTDFLKEVIQEMQEEGVQKRLSKIAQLKLKVITDYFPDSTYKHYEEFYEKDEIKDAIIERIMQLTTAYKRPQLKHKKINILRHIERVLIEDRDKEKKERNLMKYFSQKFSEIILIEDELGFGMLLKEALELLDARDVRKVMSNFDLSSSPILLQRYNIIMREHRGG